MRRMKLLRVRAALAVPIDVDVRLSRELPGWSRVSILLIPGCCDMATFMLNARPEALQVHKRSVA